jgi:hypothetical protein
MPSTWTRSLLGYRYPYDLRKYIDASHYLGWFELASSIGDREGTVAFEDHFRMHAAKSIERWLEVVFWKMYSQPRGRGDRTACAVASHLRNVGTLPDSLWNTCNSFIVHPTRENFDHLRESLGLTSQSIALAATYPSFIRPDLFPMIDTRIAKWVGACMIEHNAADPAGPQLLRFG